MGSRLEPDLVGSLKKMSVQTVNRYDPEQRPSVSVIIPAFKVTGYIGEALESVFAQRGVRVKDLHVEVIVVNDGCPDTVGLEHALQPYSGRIVYIKKENGGVSSARNAGILAARGEWLAFLDADDVWLPDYLAEQLRVLDADAGISMVFPNGIIFGDTAMAGRHTMDLSPAEPEATFRNVLAGESTIHYCAVLRRELVIKAGLFDTDLRGSEDFNLWLRMMKLGGRIVSQRKPLFRYRRRDGSLTSNSIWMNERILESLERAEETIPLSPGEHAALDKHRRSVRFELALAQGKEEFQNRRWDNARMHYMVADRIRPRLKFKLIILLLRICPGLLHSVSSWWARKSRPGLSTQNS